MRLRHLAVFPVAVVLVACAVFPHRRISLNPVHGEVDRSSAPSDLWTLTIVSAQIPPTDRGGISWSGGGPEAYVKVVRDGQVLWESAAVNGRLAPEWNATLPNNVLLPREAELRFEVWQRAMPVPHAIGMATFQGLPDEALPDAHALLHLEGGATLVVRVGEPRPSRGCGVREVEQRSDALVVVALEPFSPAGRAGVRVGDRIVAINGRPVAQTGPDRATTALSMTAGRGGSLTVSDGRGQTRETQIDAGYTWLTM